jgi:HCOMODA/2-hydroxy-3-carboxy-muconic semialdehyde decarboxylase
MIADDAVRTKLVAAAQALSRANLVHAYGHVSVRSDKASCWVTASKPLGLIDENDEPHWIDFNQPLSENVLGEVRIHREVYRRSPHVNAIVRAMPPNVMVLAAYGIVPQPRHGFGAYFSPAPYLWNDPQLLRDDAQAALLADGLVESGSRAALMRGNGSVVCGASIEEAVVLTWYLEDMARIELEGRKAGLAHPMLSPQECARRAVWGGAILDRMWDHLTRGT